MSITNLRLDLDFVVSVAMAKLKRGINVMILSLIVFVFPVMLSSGTFVAFPLLSGRKRSSLLRGGLSRSLDPRGSCG